MGVIKQLSVTLIPLSFIGCQAEKVVSSEVSRNNDRAAVAGNQKITPAVSPMSSHCIDGSDRLCPFEYSEEERKERAKIEQFNANLPKSKNDICDVSQYQKVVFEPFKKKLLPNDSVTKWEKFDGGLSEEAVFALGEYAEIKVNNMNFIFARNINIKPLNHTHQWGFPIEYMGFYDNNLKFQEMRWRKYLWFGDFALKENGKISNPWILKMMRTIFHLYSGLLRDREKAYQYYKNTKKVMRRPVIDFGWGNSGFSYDITLTDQTSFPNVEIDSDIFSNVRDFQEISDATIYVGDQELYIETHSPRRVMARISADRPVAEYKVCD